MMEGAGGENLMPKLVILKNGKIADEVVLEGAPEITIGRDPESDVSLADPSVSRHHALLRYLYSEYFVEDLASTNGTKLNNRVISKHILKSGDHLRMGKFELLFENEQEPSAEQEEDLERTVVLPSGEEVAAPIVKETTPKVATIRFFKGPDKGETREIGRSIFTIGRPDGDVAVIARRSHGFFLLRVGGNSSPKINGKEVEGGSGVKLDEGDIIEVGDCQAEISFKE
jgi:predicted component of type VI protein secretion system